MPELPEVETIRSQLEIQIKNKVIKAIKVSLPRILLHINPKDLSQQVCQQKVTCIQRRGKYLILNLSKDTIIFHLGMTGQLTIWDKSTPSNNIFNTTVTGLSVAQSKHEIDKHTHAIIEFSKKVLLFRDVRTFGKILFIKGKDWKKHPRICKLGLEPLNITWQNFQQQKLPVKSNKAIKSLLLDQKFLVGLGNIYCDETLFVCKVNPYQISANLSTKKWKELLLAAQHVLQKGIQNSGTTFSDFRNLNGEYGTNQDKLLVYGRAGKECKKCTNILQKTVLQSRSTVHCPSCQKMSNTMMK